MNLVSNNSQPVRNAGNGPNDDKAYKYGPPVLSKRLLTSAKHKIIMKIASAQTRNAAIL